MKQMSRRERVLARHQPPARRPRSLRGVAPLPERGSLAGGSGAGDAPVPRAIRLGLPEDHAARRLRRRRPGDAWRATPCSRTDIAPARAARCAPRRTGEKIRALDPGVGPGYAEEIETIIRLGVRSPDRRRAGRADALLTAFARAEAVGRPPARATCASIRRWSRAPSRRSPRRSSRSPCRALDRGRVGHLLLDPGGQPIGQLRGGLRAIRRALRPAVPRGDRARSRR